MKAQDIYARINIPLLRDSWSSGNSEAIEKEVQRRIGDDHIKVRWHLTHKQYEVWWISDIDAYVIMTLDPSKEVSSAKICHTIEKKQISARDALGLYRKQLDSDEKNVTYKKEQVSGLVRNDFENFLCKRVITS
jgi:hypothetical protein